jgi:uncharacterized repeat protein (TIGR01451 family)
MKTLLSSIFTVLFLLVPKAYLSAQQSENTVSYKVTYDFSDQKYTVWVVPEYTVPNSTNPGQAELGATAQVTLAVPKDFVISNVTDLTGSWEKSPLKLGPGQPGQDWSGSLLNPETNYYVLGKSAEETNYGTFTSGTDVPLFTFESNDCFGAVRIIEPDEPFVTAADNIFALNVANSFYSRSGTPEGGNQTPREQFRAVSGAAAKCAPDATDLSITKAAGSQSPGLNDIVTFSIVVKNNGLINATNITVKDSLPTGLQYISGAESIQNDQYFWTIGTLLPDESRTLTINARVISRGVSTNTASIEVLDQVDTDPTNDVSEVCVSVPIVLCQGETLELSAAGSSTNVQWFKDDVPFATGNTVSVTESGIYTPKSASSTCPDNNCCPIIVITEQCCPAEICIPFTVQKIR